MAASYPNSAKTFTTKNAGDAIQGAHVNDLQLEVTALETALLTGGLAHNLLPDGDGTRNLGSAAAKWIVDASQLTGALSTSITMPAASISSGALSSLVTVDGVSIVPGSIPSTTLSTSGTPSTSALFTGRGWVESTVVVVASTPQGCKVTNSTNIEIANGALTGLSWDTELYDDGGCHSTSANSSRVLFPSTGVYHIGGQVQWVSNSSGTYRLGRLYLNDTTVIAGALTHPTQFVLQMQTLFRVTDTGSYVTMRVEQNTGSTLSVAGGAAYGGGLWIGRISA